MTSRFLYITPIALLCTGLGSASAVLVSPEMFQFSGDPNATWGAPIASLDVNADTGYTWASGFDAIFHNGLGQDTTDITTNVYNVTSPLVLNQGLDSLTLNPGDKVYAYTITLVEASASTVDTIAEFQAIGLNFTGGPVMDGSLIKGRGFVDTGVNGPMGADPTDFEDLGSFGSSLDWKWPSLEADQLHNEQTITLLMFASNSISIDGLGDLRSPAGQVGGSGNNESHLIPILVPSIPTPGGAILG
ncbi:MAG: hypothetical protein WBV06_08350, partial [Acidimicrobiia bacterium]